MFRSKRKKDTTPAPEAPRDAMPSTGYQSSEVRTFDGKGHPQIIVYTRDAQGRTIKTARKLRKGEQ